MEKVLGQEAINILNRGGYLERGNWLYFKINEGIYYKSKDGLTILTSTLSDNDIKNLKWFVDDKGIEYNLTIQQIIQPENVGKYYKSDDGCIWYLQLNDFMDLELVLIEEDDNIFETYSIIQECYTIEAIVNTNFKEVQYNVR